MKLYIFEATMDTYATTAVYAESEARARERVDADDCDWIYDTDFDSSVITNVTEATNK